jgi:ketosteroid isomerase-like protein
METTNQEIVNKFFEAYSKRDMNGIKQVMAENASWTFLGQHKLAGIKNGVEEIIAFFDTMSSIMSKSKPAVNKLVTGSNDNYLVECQHIKTNREDGINIDHQVCVLWTFENVKIISGRHFFADPGTADRFFETVTRK